MEWKLLRDELPPVNEWFIVEWFGSWEKAVRWSETISVWRHGAPEHIRTEELLDHHWLRVPPMIDPGYAAAKLKRLLEPADEEEE